MGYHESLARKPVVPARALPVLQQVILIGIRRVSDDVGPSPIRYGSHPRHRGGSRQLVRLLPAQEHPFECGVVGRAPPTTREVAAVHEIPLIDHREGHPREGGRRVEVGQSEAMGELMADGADAARRAVGPQLAADGVGGELQAAADGDTRIARVRPDMAADLTARIARENTDDLIDLAVAVPVVGREVGPRGLHELFQGLADSPPPKIDGTAVALRRHIHADGAEDVHPEVEAPPRLVAEVVGHRPRTRSLVVARLVEDPVVPCCRLSHAEVAVLEADEYHRLAVGALRVPLPAGIAKRTARGRALVESGHAVMARLCCGGHRRQQDHECPKEVFQSIACHRYYVSSIMNFLMPLLP